MQNLIAITLALLCTLACVRGYEQELILIEGHTGNSFTFHSHVPNTAIYPLQNITRVCYRGHWTVYSQKRYGWEDTIFHGNPMQCQDRDFPYKSFRHIGVQDTLNDSLSLYTGMYWAGRETLLSDNTSEVKGKIQSVAWTGNSTWTLYQNRNFKGPHVCIQAPPAKFEFYAYGNIDYILHMTNVGSVKKGCDN